MHARIGGLVAPQVAMLVNIFLKCIEFRAFDRGKPGDEVCLHRIYLKTGAIHHRI
jgi:hypothetical protein